MGVQHETSGVIGGGQAEGLGVGVGEVGIVREAEGFVEGRCAGGVGGVGVDVEGGSLGGHGERSMFVVLVGYLEFEIA